MRSLEKRISRLEERVKRLQRCWTVFITVLATAVVLQKVIDWC